MSILGLYRKASDSTPFPSHCSIVTWEMGGVRASVIQVSPGTAELMGVAAVPVHGITRTSHPDVDRWLASCDKAITAAEEMTAQSSGHRIVPDHVAMSVPAEITRDLPIMVSRQRPDAKSGIAMGELEALLQRCYRRAQDAIQASTPRDRQEDLICASVTGIALDGQPVMDPLGMQGERLEMTCNFYLAPEEWIRACTLVAERLNLELLAIVPQHVAYASALADSPALLILLDEHHSVLGLVRHGRLVRSCLVEGGEREISSATAEALGLRDRQADALMRAYRARQLRDDVEAELSRSFWAQLRVWMTSMGQALRDMVSAGGGQVIERPHRIYFSDLTRRIPEALASLQTPFWEACGAFGRCPEVTSLSASDIGDVLDGTAHAGGSNYLALRALAHYVAQLATPAHALDLHMLAALR